MEKLTIAFILKQPYPDGMACSRRIHLYAKGLKELGHDVSMIIPRATEHKNVKNRALKGVFEGIPFEYTAKSTIRSASFLKRRASDVLSPIRAAIKLKKHKTDVVFLISPLFYHAWLFKLASWMCSAKYVLERNEVPFMRKDKINKVNQLYLKWLSSFFDGIVLITNELDNYYKNVINSKTKTCIIPILVDFSTFRSLEQVKNKGSSNRLVYTGSLLERKDGIVTILKAFKLVSQKFPEKKMVITGDVTKSDDYYNIIDVIDNLGIRDKVEFTGFLSIEGLNREINQADMLMLCKPDNRQNKYNFPTKVGEYLTSGVPTLISNVGETTHFLKDRISAFVCEPNVEEYASKMEEILSNREMAFQVAQNGKEVAFRDFNYKHCAPRLSHFLVQL